MLQQVLLIFFILTLNTVYAQSTKVFSVYFPFDVSEVSETEKNKAYAEVLPFVDSVKIISIQIIGNTDSYSSNDYNQTLGMKRATSVKEILADFLPVTSSISSLGKSTPKFSNNTTEGRSSNRRVDIVIEYKERISENVQYETDMLYPEQFENDTIIKFPEGVELHVKAETFYPNKIKDVTFKAQEVLSPYNIYQRGLSTMTADGRCLESGGMIFTDAQVDGQSVQPNDSILVRIPASDIDTSMKIWDIQIVDGDTLWVESDIELTYSEDGYYEFKTGSMPSINVDVPVIGAGVDLIQGIFKDKNTTIKARGKYFVECYLVSDDELIILKGDIFKPKKSYFEPCLIDPNDIVFAHVVKKDKDYYMVKPLGEIRLKNFFNRFVIRKRDLKDIKTENEYDKEVEKVCSQLGS